MAHREVRHLMAPLCQPLTQTQVIRLCPTLAIVELVDQENPHSASSGMKTPSYTAAVRSTRLSHE